MQHIDYSWIVLWKLTEYSSCCCCSVAKSCPTLCDSTDWSAPGFPVLHYLPEFIQIHDHWVGDPTNHLILCHPLLFFPSIFPSIRDFSSESALCIRGQSSGVPASASVLPINIQDWFAFRLTGLISLLSKGLSRVFSNTTVQKYQFFSTQPSLWSNSHIHTWLLEKPQLWLYGPLLAKRCLCFLICCLGWS